jgi:hypothetical protein
MSWQQFKDNIQKVSDNPAGIPDTATIAKLYAQEYDACMKRGGDTVNRVAIQKGNVELMEKLFKAALDKGLTATQPYDLVGEMGQGVLAYWTGATMNNFPTPIIPSIGAIANISVTSNIVANAGTWIPPAQLPPNPKVLPAPTAEAEAVLRDNQIEYPITRMIFEEVVPEEERADWNKDVDYDVAILKATGWANRYPPGEPYTPPTRGGGGGGGGGDGRGTTTPASAKEMYNTHANKIWPAVSASYAPGDQMPEFVETSRVPGPDGKVRIWYKQNPKYVEKNCAEVIIPLNGTMDALGRRKGKLLTQASVTVHKDLAAIVIPIFAQVKAKGLDKYLENTGGGLAVRNVTGGDRLSNHAWGTAIDLNSVRYPYGTNWNGETITTPISKTQNSVRQMDDFDRGFLQVIQLFRQAGLTWLAKNDPMHISIYE